MAQPNVYDISLNFDPNTGWQNQDITVYPGDVIQFLDRVRVYSIKPADQIPAPHQLKYPEVERGLVAVKIGSGTPFGIQRIPYRYEVEEMGALSFDINDFTSIAAKPDAATVRFQVNAGASRRAIGQIAHSFSANGKNYVVDANNNIWEFVNKGWSQVPENRLVTSGVRGGSHFPMQPFSSVGLRSGWWIDAIIVDGKSYGGNGGNDRGSLSLSDTSYISTTAVGPQTSGGTVQHVGYVKLTTNDGKTLWGGGGSAQANPPADATTQQGRVVAVEGYYGTYLNYLRFVLE